MPTPLTAGLRTSAWRAWWPPLLAAGMCLVALAVQLRFGFNPKDEGFLWYGAQRVLAGDLPLRDFQAYDPGRYFWSAAWMGLLADNGIVALRWSNAVLAAVTVLLATWTVRSSCVHASPPRVLAAGVIFSLWMAPAYKVSDSFAAIVLLFGLTRLVDRPELPRYFQAGLCWGIAAMIGINHALYGCIAGLLAFLYLRGAPNASRALMSTFAGAMVGYSPVLGLHLFAEDFSAAFVDSIRLLFEAGTTNHPLPLPSLSALRQIPEKGYVGPATEAASALIFLFVPILWVSVAWRLRRPHYRASVPPAVLAGAVLSLPYAHYAYSRADPTHLAVSILPVLAAVLASAVDAPSVRRRFTFTLALGLSLLMTMPMHPGYAYLRRVYLTEVIDTGGDRLLVTPSIATDVRIAQAVARAAGREPFYAGPYLPGAYALAGRKAPVWEIYMIFPASEARQAAEIGRIRAAGIRHAIIKDERWDYRSDLGLDRTHPLVLAFLRKCLPKAQSVPPDFIRLMTSEANRPCR